MAAKAYIAKYIFSGERWLREHAAIVDGGIIMNVVPTSTLHPMMEVEYYSDHILAPAFIDLQIYGADEKLFAVDPGIDALRSMYEYSRKGGAAFCMPTVATNQPEVFYQCIDAIRQYWQQGGKGILGLHVEGPWINKDKRGAHIESLIHSPTVEEVRELLNYGRDVIKIITLAPEICSKEVLKLIRASGIKIFAGHSNASFEQAMESFNNGVTGVTHLYNAMSPLQHRSPGLVGAAFDHPTVMASIIADGHHVDHVAISIAKKVMKHRLFAITDAVTTTSTGYYQHQPDGDKYTAGNILSGSALTMHKALQNLVNHAGIGLSEALRMCSLYPAQVIGLDDKLGKIARGYRSKLLLIPVELDDPNLQMLS
ncbi:MAG TPA: N-acetylglucosamine-6-phosphate deacetylase [Ferruginibacter sp.]|nr:N-acetylglucosamine-6-phosphate deacetylase [Ferruginibacter sp.]